MRRERREEWGKAEIGKLKAERKRGAAALVMSVPGRASLEIDGISKDATPTISALLRFAVLLAGAGWGEFTGGGISSERKEIRQNRLERGEKNAAWGRIFSAGRLISDEGLGLNESALAKRGIRIAASPQASGREPGRIRQSCS